MRGVFMRTNLPKRGRHAPGFVDGRMPELAVDSKPGTHSSGEDAVRQAPGHPGDRVRMERRWSA